MTNINVRDLTRISGEDLFDDSESFIRDLSDDEFAVQGGFAFTTATGIIIRTILITLRLK